MIRQLSGPRQPGAQAGSEAHERFRRLYEASYERILGYALRRAGAAEAHDVVAETFLTAWRRLDDVPEGEEARLWLYGVARHMLANNRRAGRRRARLTGRLRETHVLESNVMTPPDADPDVAAAFARLPLRDRELLGLVAWEQLDPTAIGRVVGASPNAVRIRLHRARRRFKAELDRAEKRRRAIGHVRETAHVAPIRAEDLL
jgi:RNA polymerase sigma-70 factor (ECF subfamily)